MKNLVQLAGCVILNEQGDILLLHRNTPQLKHWEIPGGKVEPGETKEQAAIRELNEELGVFVEGLTLLNDVRFTEGVFDYNYTWFQVSSMTGEPKALEPDKHDDVRFFSAGQMKSIILSNSARLLQESIGNGTITLK